MNIEFIILLVLVIVGFTGVFWFLARSRRQEPQQDENVFLMLQNQINEITRTLDKKLGESSELLQRQFGENVKIIGDVREKVARVEEISRQSVNSFEEIRKLQDILQNPKQRGILGEYFLETVLKNVLPPGSYQMQYPFSDKVI